MQVIIEGDLSYMYEVVDVGMKIATFIAARADLKTFQGRWVAVNSRLYMLVAGQHWHTISYSTIFNIVEMI